MEADGLQFQLLLSVSVRIHGEGEGGRGRREEVRREGERGEGVVRGRREKGRRSETEGGREGERGLLKDFCVHVYHEHYVICLLSVSRPRLSSGNGTAVAPSTRTPR